jgi:predicted DNA-binding protein (MmcQ/YjbR family)
MSDQPRREERIPGLFERTRRRLSRIALSFPESSEVIAWGHPTYRAGKRIFATLGVYYDGEVCFGFLPDEDAYRRLVKDPRCFVPPYVGHQGWLSMRVEGPLDDAEVRALCEQGYRQVALVRMLRALDAEAPAAPPAPRRKKRASRKP